MALATDMIEEIRKLDAMSVWETRFSTSYVALLEGMRSNETRGGKIGPRVWISKA